MNEATRLLIVTPNEIEGEGLRRLLMDGVFDVVGVRRNLDDTPLLPMPTGVGMILLRAASADAVRLCRTARTNWPDMRIAVMARECDSAAVAEAFRAGADGYFSVDTSVACLLEMLKLIAMGEKLVPAQVVHELASMKVDGGGGDQEVDLANVNVSERELEILQGLILGEPNKVISRRLNITEATVKVHVKSILRKLHVLNRTQAAVWALSHGLGQTVEAAMPDHAALTNGATHDAPGMERRYL